MDACRHGAQKSRQTDQHEVAVLASMPEGLPDNIASELGDQGVLPLCGFEAGLSAIAHARRHRYRMNRRISHGCRAGQCQ